MGSDRCLIDLRERNARIGEASGEAREIVSVRVHRVCREASFHTQVLNVIIQRTVKCDGHTTRYHNLIFEPILCTSSSHLWVPRFVDAHLDAWYSL